MVSLYDTGGYRGYKKPYPFTSVVKNGLVMFLDAGDTASYAGTGTTWVDLSGSGINVTLANTTYTTDSGGGIVFKSGSSGTSSASVNFSGGGFTISLWIRHTGTVSTARVQRYLTTVASSTEGPVIRHNSSSAASLQGFVFDTGNTLRTVDVADQVYTATYSNFVYAYNGSVSTIYNNAISVGTLSLSFTLPTPTTIQLSSTEFFEGNMYLVKYYNRGLSDAEVTQNFNAFRARFFV